jgi:ferrous iron transport protein B
MSQSTVHFFPPGTLVALVGNPNCGKTALFNLLTGSRQKVANYAGVTVERKEGRLRTDAGKTVRVLDLPGAYSLYPRSPDERVTIDVLNGRARGEKQPDLVVCVVDATNLRRNLRLVLAVQRLGLPLIVALNMADIARARGVRVDADALSKALGVPVVETIGVKSGGDEALRALIEDKEAWRGAILEAGRQYGASHSPLTGLGEGGSHNQVSSASHAPPPANPLPHGETGSNRALETAGDHETVRRILQTLGVDDQFPHTQSDRIDRVVLHPVIGPILLVIVLFLMFQAVFAWATVPMDAIKDGTAWLGASLGSLLPEGWIRSLVVEGIVAGLGGVVVFLPQILILFFFILILEESGYLPRAAFLLDRVMASVGLSGRSFIPLLSSFACAIPGIMAARSISNARDRWVTIMIAPLMTCSARLPVYALLIGAFVPARKIWGGVELQGLVLLALYGAGILGAMGVAWVLKTFTASGRQVRPLMMELPAYHWPTVRNLALGLWQRALIFLRRVGTIVFVLTLALWFLASFPGPPPGATGAAIEYSVAGVLGHALAVVFQPIGFNWQISIALVPGLAAREVAVGALGTVYALAATGADTAQALSPIIAKSWSLATAFSLLAWFVFAPQCLSTLATVKRETGGWKMPILMASYLFALAYLASFITYRITLALTG